MKQIPRLLLITNQQHYGSDGFLETIEAALQGGVDSILLREKQLDSARLLILAAQLRVLTHDYNATLLVHSQADICKAVDADGVHVTSHAIAEIQAMRRYLGTSVSISASCHDEIQLQQALQQGADFTFLSPVFQTGSHPDTVPLGITRFEQLAQKVDISIVALGGINEHNRMLLPDHGVAVIDSIWSANKPALAAEGLCKLSSTSLNVIK